MLDDVSRRIRPPTESDPVAIATFQRTLIKSSAHKAFEFPERFALPSPPDDKWRREQRAFHRLLPELLNSLRGQYLAIHDEHLVESGVDKLAVAQCAYSRFGYVPIFVCLVTDRPLTPVRIPSPRSVRSVGAQHATAAGSRSDHAL